jgi:hypothetical protein
MVQKKRSDFYSTVKYHLFQIFILILFLCAMIKVLEQEVPDCIFRITKIILDRF